MYECSKVKYNYTTGNFLVSAMAVPRVLVHLLRVPKFLCTVLWFFVRNKFPVISITISRSPMTL